MDNWPRNPLDKELNLFDVGKPSKTVK